MDFEPILHLWQSVCVYTHLMHISVIKMQIFAFKNEISASKIEISAFQLQVSLVLIVLSLFKYKNRYHYLKYRYL